jgi:phosphoesterase RecJ-like protein
VPTIQAIQQALEAARRILIITHVGPDGDALGSLTAMGMALAQRRKQFTLVCNDDVPSRFNYLPMIHQVRKRPNASMVYDLVIALDCGDELRMGRAYSMLPEPRPLIVNIDHHVTNTAFGAINLIDIEATSTAEILYKLFPELNIPLTTDIALSLLTGLVTDTLGFRTTGVTASTLRAASALIDAGADLSLVTRQTLNLKPLSTLRLWQIGLNKMRLEDGLMWVSITNEERTAIGYMNDSSGGLVNLLADVDRVAIGVVLMEMDDGSVRVGFRCHPPYSVSELALSLGGGGHPLASGCTLEGPLAKAEALVVESCKQAIYQQTAVIDNGQVLGE